MQQATVVTTLGLIALIVPDLASPARTQTGEELFHESFPVSSSTRLQVDLADADVRLEPGAAGSVEVSVWVDASEPEAGRDYFQRMEFEARGSDSEVRIRARDPRMPRDWWQRGRHLRVEVVVRHPPTMAIRVATGDGDILTGALSGEIQLSSSDGDIVTESLRGGPARIETSDGDVRVGSAEVSRLDVRTSDGDVDLRSVASELRASSGDGDIRVELTRAVPVSVDTGDGDVTLYAPADLAVTLDLQGEDISMDQEMTIQGRVQRGRIRGDLAGGGPEVRLTTGDGEVRVRRR